MYTIFVHCNCTTVDKLLGAHPLAGWPLHHVRLGPEAQKLRRNPPPLSQPIVTVEQPPINFWGQQKRDRNAPRFDFDFRFLEKKKKTRRIARPRSRSSSIASRKDRSERNRKERKVQQRNPRICPPFFLTMAVGGCQDKTCCMSWDHDQEGPEPQAFVSNRAPVPQKTQPSLLCRLHPTMRWCRCPVIWCHNTDWWVRVHDHIQRQSNLVVKVSWKQRDWSWWTIRKEKVNKKCIQRAIVNSEQSLIPSHHLAVGFVSMSRWCGGGAKARHRDTYFQDAFKFN